MILRVCVCVYVVGDHSTTAWGESVFKMPLCGLISKFTKVCVCEFILVYLWLCVRFPLGRSSCYGGR